MRPTATSAPPRRPIFLHAALTAVQPRATGDAVYRRTGTGGSRQATHDSFLNDWNTLMEHMERIAFIGLGIMGSPMAKRLLAAGYPLTVWNRTASRAEPLQAEGANVAASPAEAVREADVVITMLADPTAVREVIDDIARHLRPGTTLIEASTIGPQTLEEVAALLPGSVALVDAPVMGSADRAASGQLIVLAGGNLTRVRPILEVFGTVTECGADGHRGWGSHGPCRCTRASRGTRDRSPSQRAAGRDSRPRIRAGSQLPAPACRQGRHAGDRLG